MIIPHLQLRIGYIALMDPSIPYPPKTPESDVLAPPRAISPDCQLTCWFNLCTTSLLFDIIHQPVLHQDLIWRWSLLARFGHQVSEEDRRCIGSLTEQPGELGGLQLSIERVFLCSSVRGTCWTHLDRYVRRRR